MAHPCEAHQLIDRALSLMQCIAERFECDIEPELVPVAEKIGNGFGDRIDLQFSALALVDLNPFSQCRAREPDDPRFDEGDFRCPRFPPEGEPDLVWILGCDCVKA